jgi:hypothetical protein
MKPEQTDLPKASLKQLSLAFVGLFGSLSTLICCALPALLVAMGLGATVAGLTTQMPWLISLSQHKEWLFAISFALMSLSAFSLYRARNAPCPIDPIQRIVCQYGRRISVWAISISFVLWFVGYTVAFHPALVMGLF